MAGAQAPFTFPAPMSKRIFIAIPTLTGKPTPQTETALQCAAMESMGLGWKCKIFRWSHDSLIQRARNVILAKFLKSGYTDLVCVDDDVAWGPGVFTKLMLHDVEFVCGMYRKKLDDECYAVNMVAPVTPTEKGLIEAEAVPFGFVRMTRDAVKKISAHYADQWFAPHEEPTLKAPNIFATDVVDHVFVGEDFMFCRRWKEMGGAIHIDVDLPLHHVSRDTGKMFSGTFRKWLVKEGLIAR